MGMYPKCRKEQNFWTVAQSVHGILVLLELQVVLLGQV